jgi:hypothetical protein
MRMKNPADLIPEHQSGTQTNTESSIELEDEHEAKRFYPVVKKRLLDVNDWHRLAGKASADFQLTDEKGLEADRPARKGDHLKIDIPGPGTVTGKGHDWARIEAIEEKDEAIAIKVRPSPDPRSQNEDVAHFFSQEASSSFIVRRDQNKIIAGVYGRNEKPNTAADAVIDKIRNAAIATGAISGFSKLQWKGLVEGLVERDGG